MLYSLFVTIFSFFEDKKNNTIRTREVHRQRIGGKNLRQEKCISRLSACQLFDDCQTLVAENFHCFLFRLLILDCLDYEWWFQESTSSLSFHSRRMYLHLDIYFSFTSGLLVFCTFWSLILLFSGKKNVQEMAFSFSLICQRYYFVDTVFQLNIEFEIYISYIQFISFICFIVPPNNLR